MQHNRFKTFSLIINIGIWNVTLKHKDLKIHLFNKLNCTVSPYFMFIILHFVKEFPSSGDFCLKESFKKHFITGSSLSPTFETFLHSNNFELTYYKDCKYKVLFIRSRENILFYKYANVNFLNNVPKAFHSVCFIVYLDTFFLEASQRCTQSAFS